jgi:hypothetical protein
MNYATDEDNLWDEFEASSMDSYETLWRDEISYYENVVGLIKRTAYHSEMHTLAPILAAYTCFHSVAANFAPILFFGGASGTGKSKLSELIASIRGCKGNILGGSSTFASIRNVLQESRWRVRSQSLDEPQDTRRSNEKPCLLVWADIKAANLQDPKMYGLLRNGTSRGEDKLTIAGEGGKNYEFYVFSPKILSSIEDFYNEAQYSELKRRILLIRTEKMKDDSYNVGLWADNCIDPSDYDWKGCKNQFRSFWEKDRILELAALKKNAKVATRLKKLKWDSHHITAYSDLILQHAVLADSSIGEICDIWTKYIDIKDGWMRDNTVSVDGIISQFTEHAEEQAVAVELKSVRIEHNIIHARLIALKLRAYTEQISPIMQHKGYSPVINGSVLSWVKEL